MEWRQLRWPRGGAAAASADLVHPDTVAGTTEALQQWLALPEAERRAMGERGRALFAERFEIGAAAADLRDLVLAISDGRKRP